MGRTRLLGPPRARGRAERFGRRLPKPVRRRVRFDDRARFPTPLDAAFPLSAPVSSTHLAAAVPARRALRPERASPIFFRHYIYRRLRRPVFVFRPPRAFFLFPPPFFLFPSSRDSAPSSAPAPESLSGLFSSHHAGRARRGLHPRGARAPRRDGPAPRCSFSPVVTPSWADRTPGCCSSRVASGVPLTAPPRTTSFSEMSTAAPPSSFEIQDAPRPVGGRAFRPASATCAITSFCPL